MLRYLFKDFVCSICVWLSGMGVGVWGGGGQRAWQRVVVLFLKWHKFFPLRVHPILKSILIEDIKQEVA